MVAVDRIRGVAYDRSEIEIRAPRPAGARHSRRSEPRAGQSDVAAHGVHASSTDAHVCQIAAVDEVTIERKASPMRLVDSLTPEE